MIFDEWFNKEYKPADLQINQCAERNEGLHIPAKVYLEDLKESYEDFMKENFKAISGCTHIAMLEGWETSPGARKEKAEAERLGLEVMYYRTIGGKK